MPTTRILTEDDVIRRNWVLRGAPRLTNEQAKAVLDKWEAEIEDAARAAAELLLDQILTDLDPVQSA